MQNQEGARIVAPATLPFGGSGKVPWIVAGALAVVGVVAYALALSSQSMAGTSFYPWGLYIAVFYAAASAGAGVLIVTGLCRCFALFPAEVAARLFSCACALLVAASVLIAVDLGNPAAIMLTYLSANVASPVFFDALVLPLCIVVAVIAALVCAKSADATVSVAQKALAVASMVAGFVLLGVEAWLLTTCSGKDAWGVLLGAGPARLQACTMAVCVVACFVAPTKVWRALLGVLLLVTVGSFVFDVALNQGDATVLERQLAAIASEPLFTVAAVGGVAGALVALIGRSKGMLSLAAGLGLASVLLFKIAVIDGTQAVAAVPGLGNPGTFPVGFSEVLVVVGIAGIAVLVYLAALKILDVVARKEQAEKKGEN